jgi:hypothetical protein
VSAVQRREIRELVHEARHLRPVDETFVWTELLRNGLSAEEGLGEKALAGIEENHPGTLWAFMAKGEINASESQSISELENQPIPLNESRLQAIKQDLEYASPEEAQSLLAELEEMQQ